MDSDSVSKRKKDCTGTATISSADGEPNDRKSACSTMTKTIAVIRSNSIFDERTLC